MRYNVRMREIHKTYRLRGYCSRGVHKRIALILGLTREIYNAARLDRKERWRLGRKGVSRYDQFKMLTEARQGMPELREYLLAILREPLDRLDKAYKAFFGRIKAGERPGYPRRKGSGWWKSFGPVEAKPGMVKVVSDGRYNIRLKGIGCIRVKTNRRLPDSDQLVGLRVKREGKKIWICLTYREWVADDADTSTFPIPLHNAIGIDMGVSARATFSDGSEIARVRVDKRRKRRLQRKLTRAVKGSASRRRKRRDYARECNRLAHAQAQATHRQTTELVRKHDFIVFEELEIKNMTKSAKGTADKPGKRVAQKRGLNREILEQGWGQFQSQLRYKAAWAGKATKDVPPHYTSQTCSGCGIVDGSQRKKKRYDCACCGLSIDADHNAAINILKRGLCPARVGTGRL